MAQTYFINVQNMVMISNSILSFDDLLIDQTFDSSYKPSANTSDTTTSTTTNTITDVVSNSSTDSSQNISCLQRYNFVPNILNVMVNTTGTRLLSVATPSPPELSSSSDLQALLGSLIGQLRNPNGKLKIKSVFGKIFMITDNFISCSPDLFNEQILNNETTVLMNEYNEPFGVMIITPVDKEYVLTTIDKDDITYMVGLDNVDDVSGLGGGELGRLGRLVERLKEGNYDFDKDEKDADDHKSYVDSDDESDDGLEDDELEDSLKESLKEFLDTEEKSLGESQKNTIVTP